MGSDVHVGAVEDIADRAAKRVHGSSLAIDAEVDRLVDCDETNGAGHQRGNDRCLSDSAERTEREGGLTHESYSRWVSST
ncbi:hypothetical protein GCM10027344_04640 [Spelaeicoccus albus]